jgi:hypothetical protein
MLDEFESQIGELLKRGDADEPLRERLRVSGEQGHKGPGALGHGQLLGTIPESATQVKLCSAT